MLRTRRSVPGRLGLWSTACTIVSRSTAKTIGTRWGRPSGPTVASRATRAPANRSRACAAVTATSATCGNDPVELQVHVGDGLLQAVREPQLLEARRVQPALLAL